MTKAFVGAQIRRLREDRGLTQAALARQLDLSPSYLNQLERNQRPLTVPVLVRLSTVLGVDVQVFSEEDEGRLLADLQGALREAGVGEGVSLRDLKELVRTMPEVGRAVIALHQQARAGAERLEALAHTLGAPVEGLGPAPPPLPHEEVRDYFYERHNHIPELDEAGERLYADGLLALDTREEGLERLLADRHRIRVRVRDDITLGADVQRRFDPDAGVLALSRRLTPGQRLFQMATQLAFLEHGALIARLTEVPGLGSPEARALARIGLANYFAGAAILPYGPFLEAAEARRYDIDVLGEIFGVGFETVCHRLSTLQRPEARGVPFVFVRVDRAGNISKRQSATDFHFSRVGGSCPLWIVHDAFATPGRTLTQLARMPDGRRTLWVARTVIHQRGGFGQPEKVFALGLGCDLRHAPRLVYARGLDLNDPEAATPIGGGCKVCERTGCVQRAFPPLGRRVQADEGRSHTTPYAFT
ncbi:short-chain fatty acyl-CoA regulator family protein [Pararhodospirillum oryzae]|uniref:XRE family transcriptional regulator n=1 Tax=Pararhodospirillum oryzae TaxID=478448 RepID=A0A512H5Q4_9PROT|nr:short-chain fatty acyl-CoA regulator family protein [Pararhodospirillum oryzae]GEO80710.1 XRE family transcriptional regulator [Pararhodospirillum oryzae]